MPVLTLQRVVAWILTEDTGHERRELLHVLKHWERLHRER